MSEFDHGRVKRYNSHRAGGTFEVTIPGNEWVSNLTNAQCAVLTSWILQGNVAGEIPSIDSRLLQIVQRRRMSAAQRADRLLEYLASHEPHLGAEVVITGDPDFDFDGNVRSLQAAAWAECTNDEELIFLLSELEKLGYVHIVQYANLSWRVNLTLEGHARVAELSHSGMGSAQAFVAMWFDKSMSAAYFDGIEPSIADSGFQALRIDRKETIGKIDDEIIAEIRRSRFIVADFTSELDKPRGGVYFEAGFAMGLNIPVIWSCRSDCIASVHFDTRQFSHIVWDTPGDLREKLTYCIGSVIGWGPLTVESSPTRPSPG